jgi:hypothetical protein
MTQRGASLRDIPVPEGEVVGGDYTAELHASVENIFVRAADETPFRHGPDIAAARADPRRPLARCSRP